MKKKKKAKVKIKPAERRLLLQNMRNIREERRSAGFKEVAVWIPEEKKEDLKNYAIELRTSCGRRMPKSNDP